MPRLVSCSSCGHKHFEGSDAQKKCVGGTRMTGSGSGKFKGLISWIELDSSGDNSPSSSADDSEDDYYFQDRTNTTIDTFHEDAPLTLTNCYGVSFIRGDMDEDDYMSLLELEKEHRELHRIRFGEYSYIRLQFDREISEEEAERAAQLMGYLHKTKLKTQREASKPIMDGSNSFMCKVDMQGSRSYNALGRTEEFCKELEDFFNQGSPVRKTNRAGKGTQGTRLVEPMEDRELASSMKVYYGEDRGNRDFFDN